MVCSANPYKDKSSEQEPINALSSRGFVRSASAKRWLKRIKLRDRLFKVSGVDHRMAMAVWQTMGGTAGLLRPAFISADQNKKSKHHRWLNCGAKTVVRLMLVAAIAAFALAPRAQAQNLPGGFSIETIANNLQLPVAFDLGLNGMIYVAEKSGRVAVVDNGQVLNQRFIDISSKVNTNSDRGLLAIAVDPDFPSSPYIYLLYTYDPPEVFGNANAAGPDGAGNRVSRLSRFTADASTGYRTALPNTETVLLGTNSVWGNIGNPAGDYNSTLSCQLANGNYVRDCVPIDELSHTIGDMRFAPDGALIVSSGDGASYHNVSYGAIRAQHLDSLSGKILRIDRETGNGLPDNPHYNGDPSANRSKVWSLGLRNPFRFTLHPTTGEPVIGDVGWANWEEINVGSDRNFGWPCYEGASGFNAQLQSYAGFGECQDLYNVSYTATAPVYAYDHLGQSASVQLGDYYRGQKWPGTYRGALFFSDINRSVVEYLTFDNAGAVTSQRTFATDMGGIAQMRYVGGDIYFLNLYHGALQVFRYDAQNEPPVAVIRSDVTTGFGPLDVAFVGTDSYDPEGQSLSFYWEFGDGGTSQAPNPTHRFNLPGMYAVRLTVTDAEGISRYATTQIDVDNLPPSIQIQGDPGAALYQPGQWVTLNASATDPDEGALAGSTISWDGKLLHAEHIHPNFYAGTGASAGFVYPDHGDDTRLRLCATTTDAGGLTAKQCAVLKPRTVEYTMQTEPPGLAVTFNGVTRAAPFSITTVVGGRRTISASQVNNDGTTFDRWSDGGTLTHEIPIGGQPRTLTAFFSSGSDTDGDGVLNSDEILWGTNFYAPDPDSDGDGVPDFIDSDPASAEDRGRSLLLVPDVSYRDRYGHEFGDSEYFSRLRVAFENPATDVVLSVNMTMFSSGEIKVFHSKDGSNFVPVATLTDAKSKIVLTSSQLGWGRNWLSFESKTPGESWGIRKIRLIPISSPPLDRLRTGVRDGRSFGNGVGDNQHPWLVRTSFGWLNGPHELRFKLFNQIQRRQVAVYLNGVRIYQSRAGEAGEWSDRISVPLPENLITGQNVVEFVTRAGARPWGVKRLIVRPVQ